MPGASYRIILSMGLVMKSGWTNKYRAAVGLLLQAFTPEETFDPHTHRFELTLFHQTERERKSA
jgi:hypothetical protein